MINIFLTLSNLLIFINQTNQLEEGTNMKQNSALLIMDMQNGIAKTFPGLDEIVASSNEAIETARKAGIPVIFVRVAFSKNFSEVSPNNKVFTKIKNSGQTMTTEDDSTQIISTLNIKPDDLIITKQRFSAFTGSNLDVLLSGLEVDHLILSGVATSGVVLSTAVEAFDKDFKLTFLEDASADRDIKVHDFLINSIFPKYGDVLTTKAWTEKINN